MINKIIILASKYDIVSIELHVYLSSFALLDLHLDQHGLLLGKLLHFVQKICF